MQFNGLNLQRSVHGGINPGELRLLGLEPKHVLDFSANINPLGVSPYVKKAVSDIEMDHYPDPDCMDLGLKLSMTADIAIENIVIGNGSTELVHLFARSCISNKGCAAILSPTFGEYEFACRLVNATPVLLVAKEWDSFQWDITNVCQELAKIRPQLVFLCNPNNPTGLYLDEDSVRQIAKAVAPEILVIDEAYLPFVEKPWDSKSLLSLGNVVLLRSMTKDHALAGLRLGYALASVQLVEALKLYQPFWSVNSAAQIAGVAALTDMGHVSRAREIVSEGRSYLSTAIGELGLKVIPSSANFILIKVGDAKEIRKKLLMKNLCVRDCSSFGLPQYIRIAVRTLPECQKLVEGLKGEFNG